MERRNFLKVAPLAALAAVPVVTQAGEVQRFEIKEDKRYLFVFKEIDPDDLKGFADNARAEGFKGMFIAGDVDLSIYEFPK